MFYTYDDNRLLRRIIRIIVMFIVLISMAWFIVYGFMGQTVVNGQSMAPVLDAEDVCLVNRLKTDILRPDRYDIILFERADTDKLNIKRVIGLPGEAIQISDGAIYVDGVKLEDERMGNITIAGISENEVLLADDEYFVLGDNVEASEDSRFANIGNVKESSIRGVIWFKIQPLSEFGFVN